MNKDLNDMIESFLDGKYEAKEFVFDFDDAYAEVDIDKLEHKYITMYDNINEACSLFDDSNTHDNRLINENQLRERIKKYYKVSTD